METLDRVGISIHALRGEGDENSFDIFYTTEISIHALRGEGDTGGLCFGMAYTTFQSTPSVGRAT